jgi:hypothetical protein
MQTAAEVRQAMNDLLADPDLARQKTPGPQKRQGVVILEALRALPQADQNDLLSLERRLGLEVFGITQEDLAARKK